MSFSEKIIGWYQENGRNLPWRQTEDPYKIWLSEIILQQTRIEQGRAYWERFVERYPTVGALAEARLEEVLKLWQGLGYYSRARNLHVVAQDIARNYGGVFPDTYDKILSLKGVGPYTAAAIASFAFHEPRPVIDGNVYRLIARLYAIYTPIATPQAYREFGAILNGLIDRERPHLFNQAIMDFGSTYCRPLNPDCGGCIFAEQCRAYREGKVQMLPVKALNGRVKERFFYYLDLYWTEGEEVLTLMHERESKDIWKGLYEMPLIESDKPLSASRLQSCVEEMVDDFFGQKAERLEIHPQMEHKLTHRTIYATFITLNLGNATLKKAGKESVLTLRERKSKPISRLIDKYFSQLLIK